MIKKTTLFVLLSVILLLVACGDKELSREEVIEKIKEKQEEVENYNTSSLFEIDIGEGEVSDHSTASIEVTIIEPTNEIRGKTEETDNMDNTIEEEFYATEDVLYIRSGDNDWTEEIQNDNFDAKESISISYDDFYQLFEKMEDELEFTEEDDYYLFTFDDTSQTIFDGLKEPYNANVSGIEEDAINHEVHLKVDKDNFYFMEFEDNMSGDTVGGPLQFDITHDFSDINDIDKIEVPDGV